MANFVRLTDILNHCYSASILWTEVNMHLHYLTQYTLKRCANQFLIRCVDVQ